MDGDTKIHRPYYKNLIDEIRQAKNLLNLGSGVAFAFETYCRQINHNLNIFSADRLELTASQNIVSWYQQVDLESNFTIKDAPEFDLVCLFEVIEHVDKTDALIKNAMRYCRPGGCIAISFPNLSSLLARLELLAGFQPHILEVSNELANFGMGLVGRLNNPSNQPLHHIRGITSRAANELLQHHGLKIRRTLGSSWGILEPFWRYIPSLAPINLFVCENPDARVGTQE